MSLMPHPLYTAAERLLERGMSRRRMLRLRSLFRRHSLPLPTDLAIVLSNAGIIP